MGFLHFRPYGIGLPQAELYNTHVIDVFYKKIHEKKFSKIEDLRKGAWVSLVSPNVEEVEKIATDLALDLTIVNDALDPYEMPRIEVEDGIKYIFARYPVKRGDTIETEPSLVIITDDNFITIAKHELPLIHHLDISDINTTQRAKLFIHFLKAVNDEFNKYVHLISKQVKTVSSNLEIIENKDISRLVEYERILNDFLYALIPANIVFERILYGKMLKLYEQDEDLVQDLTLGTTQLIEMCKANLKYIVNIREAYSTILSNKLNKTMKILTSVTVLLTIPTIIFSFFGMNVILPFQDHMMAAFVITCLTIIFMLLLVLAFFRSKLFK